MLPDVSILFPVGSRRNSRGAAMFVPEIADRCLARVVPLVGDEAHAGFHLEFGECMQVDLRGNHGSVTQPPANPIERVTEDHAVRAALLGVLICLVGDVAALQLLERDDREAVAEAVRVNP